MRSIVCFRFSVLMVCVLFVAGCGGGSKPIFNNDADEDSVVIDTMADAPDEDVRNDASIDVAKDNGTDGASIDSSGNDTEIIVPPDVPADGFDPDSVSDIGDAGDSAVDVPETETPCLVQSDCAYLVENPTVCRFADCDRLTGKCRVVLANGSECDDGDTCTVYDECRQGVCIGANRCADDDPCTIDGCAPGGDCVHQRTTGPCDDGLNCTVDDSCATGECVGILNECADENECTADYCDETAGCVNEKLSGTGCSDNSPCTVSDSCLNGLCTGVPVECDDFNPCTDDECGGNGECRFVPNSNQCSDDNPCTVGDRCADKSCVPGTGNLCEDSDECTIDICLPGGTCVYERYPETCNLKDDDCDGMTDEDLGSTTCGTGICINTVDNCVDGNLTACEPKPSSFNEICNGFDDDCNGATDDGLGTTICGLGICRHEVDNCIDGNPQICDPFEGSLPDDPVDGSFLDEDCDGIDGNPDDAVFVDAAYGNDGWPGTMAQPKKTIAGGIMKAFVDGKKNVLVSEGEYAETVTLLSGIGVHGGYIASLDWIRDPRRMTVISGGSRAVIAQGLTMVTVLSGLTIASETDFSNGASSYAVWSSQSPGLILESVILKPGSGAPGFPGAAGNPGNSGANGFAGSPGCEYSGGLCGVCSQPSKGGGGLGGCSSETAGGNGGVPGTYINNGTSGSKGFGDSGGVGGNGGSPGGSGYPGKVGAVGLTGAAGEVGAPGYLTATGFQSVTGGPGVRGSEGSGGGGGGGGGGNQACTLCCGHFGGAGGGGGGGGCGGTGGTGGTGGGGSFGVFVGQGMVVLRDVQVIGGDGGRGGNGGKGGSGGSGGLGAGGGSGSGGSGGGGSGGNGGKGGNGGSGGPGSGGPSVGLACGPNGFIEKDGELVWNPGQGGGGGLFMGGGAAPDGAVAESMGCP